MKGKKARVAFSFRPVSIFDDINFRFLFFSGLSQTFEKSSPGLSEAQKLAGSVAG